uniref:Peptidase M14 domain-containing protein n=1 Tax=Spongospora subterranea TaxID=70186 RepID=A0A0H5QH23_9EUKA|eukprot:CRZ00937.1 hypothetical protein [Spongospora subterranea]
MSHSSVFVRGQSLQQIYQQVKKPPNENHDRVFDEMRFPIPEDVNRNLQGLPYCPNDNLQESVIDEPLDPHSTQTSFEDASSPSSFLVYDSSHPQRADRQSRDGLIFNSRFECGNLDRVYRRSPSLTEGVATVHRVYDLWLRPDRSSSPHTQWFYFGVDNIDPFVDFTFNIVNLVKPSSLYATGMRVLMYDERQGWHRGGRVRGYGANSFRDKKTSNPFYTLSFDFQANEDQRWMYMAYSYPYSYTRLQQYLDSISAEIGHMDHCRRDLLCRSFSGNNVDVLTITDFTAGQDISSRSCAVITGRVHPGEPNSSWIMEGIISFLIGSSPSARRLRQMFIFTIIPMLNPDGVIDGSYRTGGSATGSDLNRVWHNPSRRNHPTIFATKMLMKRLSKERPIHFFIDLHGHSRRHNMFMYGCPPTQPTVVHAERILPRMLWRLADNFSFQDCRFEIQKCKKNTARAVVSREFACINSYTLEASFAGSNQSHRSGLHYNQRDYREMGERLCEGLLRYSDDQYRDEYECAHRELLLYYPETNEIVFDPHKSFCEKEKEGLVETSKRIRMNRAKSIRKHNLKIDKIFPQR